MKRSKRSTRRQSPRTQPRSSHQKETSKSTMMHLNRSLFNKYYAPRAAPHPAHHFEYRRPSHPTGVTRQQPLARSNEQGKIKLVPVSLDVPWQLSSLLGLSHWKPLYGGAPETVKTHSEKHSPTSAAATIFRSLSYGNNWSSSTPTSKPRSGVARRLSVLQQQRTQTLTEDSSHRQNNPTIQARPLEPAKLYLHQEHSGNTPTASGFEQRRQPKRLKPVTPASHHDKTNIYSPEVNHNYPIDDLYLASSPATSEQASARPESNNRLQTAHTRSLYHQSPGEDIARILSRTSQFRASQRQKSSAENIYELSRQMEMRSMFSGDITAVSPSASAPQGHSAYSSKKSRVKLPPRKLEKAKRTR